MPANNNTSIAAFIREHRGNEANFEKLYRRLEDEITRNESSEKYVAALKEIMEKSAEEYKTASKNRDTAWPEFENFVSDFEKAVINEP